MIRHHVQHQPNPPLYERLAQRNECCVATQVRVNVAVIFDIVFVIAGRGENGREIERRDAQLLQIVQLLENTLQVAPKEFDGSSLLMTSWYFSPGASHDRTAITQIFPAAHIVGWIA